MTSRTCTVRLLVSMLAMFVGCACQPTDRRPSRNIPTVLSSAGVQRVEMANLSTRTPALDASSLSPAQWLERFRRLRNEPMGRQVHWVKRFPDVAIELLRDPVSHSLQDADCMQLAAAYDAAFCQQGTSGGWSGLYGGGLRTPHAMAYFQRRARILSLIEQGRFDLADDHAQSAPSDSSPLFRAEYARLHGVVQCLRNRPGDALLSWQAAAQLLAQDANASAELAILIYDARRRSPSVPADPIAWTSAVIRLGTIQDPNLWQRAIELRPDQTAWPSTSTAARSNPNPPTTEGIWAQIGQWRLARGEASQALLAFSKAESSSIDVEKEEARIGQARALLVLKQSVPAMNLLANLVASPRRQVARHATALIGVAKLEAGDVADGTAFLLRAIDADGPAWPEYPQALADLGLAQLMQGNEVDGLNRLRSAQEQFQVAGNVPELAKCIENEARYFEKAGKPDVSASARKRARQVWETLREN